MSFFNREKSHDKAAPIELYDFYQGTIHWRYTNADRDIVFDSYTWKAIPIKRNEISQTPEVARLGLKIEADRTIEVYSRFRIAPPGSPVGCTVYTFHYEDDVAVPEWTGRIISCVRKDSRVSFVGEPAYVSMMTTGLRRNWQRSCPHLLYGQGCKVVKELYAVNGVIQAVGGIQIQVSAAGTFPNYYFEGGYVAWEDSLGLPVYRSIEEHIGAALKLSYTVTDLVLGQAVTLYPGCDHSMQMCKDRYDNLLNYGGTPYIPQKSPYDGSPVF